jgi:acylphosphatase
LWLGSRKWVRKKAKWNELKGELNNLMDATPLFIIIN